MMSTKLLRTCCHTVRTSQKCYSTNRLTNEQVQKKRSDMFGKEKARQMSLITRVEKVTVQHEGPPENCTLLMNKGLSTPFNCAMHIQELLMRRSALALVNGIPWDMHRPLEDDATLTFLHFKDEDPDVLNQAFWRTCSFVLGYVLSTAFKDKYYVELCSFPKPNVRSGSFVYDVNLNIDNWKPTTAELNCLSRIGAQLYHRDIPFERLEVDATLAQTMFEDNRYKVQQIPSIAAQSPGGSKVTLYRMGEHVDISRGPLVASTAHCNRFSVTQFHDIVSKDYGPLQRVQGMAMPTQLKVHFWTYEMLCKRSKQLNAAPIPSLEPHTKREMVADV